jgi:hypothetical protein
MSGEASDGVEDATDGALAKVAVPLDERLAEHADLRDEHGQRGRHERVGSHGEFRPSVVVINAVVPDVPDRMG